tara:strand:- start:108 stop:980 length:873 start_codon:yes stop_codon:yes gene_type:complete
LKLIFKTSVLIIITAFIFGICMTNKQNGSVVLLNGVSSSGKSAIINELVTLHPKLKVLKVDDWFPDALKKTVKGYGWNEDSGVDPWLFLYEYAFKKTGEYYFNTQVREKFFNNSADFYKQALDLVTSGHDVIIDTVLEYETEYTEFDTFFNNIQTKKILIYCPMDILLDRVEQRNKAGISAEQRTAFQSFEQFPAMFKVQESLRDQVVDHVQTSTIKQSLDEAIVQLLDNNIPEPYIPKLHKFKTSFIKQFRLNQQDVIILSPQHIYDIILDSSVYSPKESAEKIISILH